MHAERCNCQEHKRHALGDTHCITKLNTNFSELFRKVRVQEKWLPNCRPAHALWCCAQGRGEAACDARFVSAAWGVQRAQQGCRFRI